MSVNNGSLLLLVSVCSVVVCSEVAAQEQNAILELTVNQDILVSLPDLEKAGLESFAGSRETINNETYSTFRCNEVHFGRARCPPHKSFMMIICTS
ncbi:hypothetical protein [Sphaerospermopsis torques-reginae]|uniref:hypothetical protein n=1 Tax=Sphaerospermopsis torques-reginae TaxID=984207 RepID=UPI001FE3306F|nr:hypothetical protein [Sphaerospermopsis torques-reginae]